MNLLPPNETQLEHIKKQDFYQSADQLDQDVTRLIEWMAKQPHLPEIKDRKWLSHFIVGCKYNLHKAKQVIDSYFVSRAEHQEFLGSFDREHITEATKTGAISVFPKLTPDGYRIICTKTRPTVDEKFDALCYCRANLAVLDILLKEEPMHGSTFLFDLKYLRLSQFLVVTPTMTKNIFSCCINSFPLRVGTAHFINPPKFISSLVSFFKMFVPAKIKDRLLIHDTLEEFHQYIPKDVLPDIYGGTAGKIEQYEEDLFECLLNSTEYLENRKIADLSKRPGQQKTNDFGTEDDWFEYCVANTEWYVNRKTADLFKRVGQPNNGNFGVDGTFKQLQID